MARPRKSTLSPRYRRRTIRRLVAAAIIAHPPPDAVSIWVLEVLRLALPAETWIEGAEMAMDVIGRAITNPVVAAVQKTLDSGTSTE